MYSIIDIESSGGQFGEEKIIEIAIYKFDGKEIIDQFSTLVNPEKPIDKYVQKLTGITDKMVKRVPKFHEIAKRVVEMTKDTLLVAHNAEFDYRMLRQEFRELGYPFQIDAIDTIHLSQHLLPGQESYGLKKLTKSLGIVHLNQHRAHGDALATVELFKILLDKDDSKSIIEKSINNKLYSNHAPKILKILEELPHAIGVYYIHDINGKIIYIGVAKDIYNRLHKTYTSKDFFSRKIQNKADKISFETTGSLLLAKIKYLQEKNILQPKLNRYDKYLKLSFRKGDLNYPEENMLILDNGRSENEKSFFVIRYNQCIGYGYYKLASQIDTEEKLLNRMSPIKENALMRQQIIEYSVYQESLKEN